MKPVPIHTAAINGIPVRFFASPFPEEPDFPWVAYADLTLAARVERGFRQHYKAALKRDWKDGWKVVDTADGELLLIAHFAAQGLIGGAIEIGSAPASTKAQYARAGADALKSITDGLEGTALLDWIGRAFRRWEGARQTREIS